MNTRFHWAVPAGWAAALVVGLITPFVISDYSLFDLARVLTIAMAVAGLNLLLGHSGQISVGHGAIFGLGGYAALISVAIHGWPWFLGVLLAAAMCLAFGLLLGLLALRMGGANLGLLTIAVASILPLLLIRMEPLTGGTFGVFAARSPIEAPAWTGLTAAQFGFLVCLVFLALTLLLLHNLVTGRMGRSLSAVRTSTLLAAANGVNVNRTKLIAFAISAIVTGTGGALYALVMAIAVPDSYLVPFSITLLAASVVGGCRTWAGAVVGGAIVVYLPTLAGTVVGGQSAGNWSQLVYACCLLLTLVVAPAGLVGAAGDVARRVVRPGPARSPADVGGTQPTRTRRADRAALDQ